MHDVLIIGGGPAGSAAAITLAQAGKKVLVLERGGPGRDKACGDGLIADALAALTELGVLDAVRATAHPIRAFTFSIPGGDVELPVPALVLPRAQLDALLLAQAQRLGAAVEHHTPVSRLRHASRGVTVEVLRGLQTVTYSGRHAILATGADVTLARQLGARIGPHSAMAARGYYPLKHGALDGRALIAFQDELSPGYGWIFPISTTHANAGIGYSMDRAPRHASLNALMARFLHSALARRYLADGRTGNYKGAPLRSGLRFRDAGVGRVLLAGECVHTTYDFTGEGIGKALLSGMLAARSVLEAPHDPAAHYRRLLESKLRPWHRGYTLMHRVARHPHLMAVAVRLGGGPLKPALCRVFNEEIPAQQLLNPWTLARAMR